MRYDLLIKNGTVVDGTGFERYEADVGVSRGHIEAIGKINAPADEVIDARDLVVAPGFIDGHTHLDAQIFWEPLGTSSCYQGVTTAIFGNCGFTLAPIKAELSDILLEHFEAAEALPLESLKSGIDIRWETFPEYFDVLDEIPKGINYAGYVGHSALRIHAMGDRAFSTEPTDADVAQMADNLGQALRAGAIGFSTSRVSHQRLRDGRLISSGHAPWKEVSTLVQSMGSTGVFELAREKIIPGEPYDFPDRLRELAARTGRPTMLGVFHAVDEPGAASAYMEMIERGVQDGAQMVAQVHTNTMYEYFSFLARTPFSTVSEWAALRGLPREECLSHLTNAETRRQLIVALDALQTPPDYDTYELVQSFHGTNPKLGELARQRGCHPGELVIDEAISANLDLFIRYAFANVEPDQTLSLLKHPQAVPTFSDAGAHVSEVADTCIPSMLIGRWVRERGAFSLEQAVHMITGKMARVWGLKSRGTVAVGKVADLAVFDPDQIAPTMPRVLHDFPNGMARIAQGCDGMVATIVNGTPLLSHGEHTGNLPGRLLRAN